jgi:dUTP pyrophosphatase
MKKQAVQLKILDSRIGTEFPMPTYATKKSAGIDLCACNKEPLTLKPGDCELIPTGISIYLEDPNITALITPRSGLGSKKGIVLGNLTGVIDADYQGPLMVPLWNRGKEDFILEPGTRMAQMLIVPIIHADFQIVNEFNEQSQRGEGGFGHTGQ